MIFHRRLSAIALAAAILSWRMLGDPLAAQELQPGIWAYGVQDGLHKATVADLSGFFQVQCKDSNVTLVLLINSEGPLLEPTTGRSTIRVDGEAFPVELSAQPDYSTQTGAIHSTLFLVSMSESGNGVELLRSIKRAHAFIVDRDVSVYAFSARGSSAAIGKLERNCTKR